MLWSMDGLEKKFRPEAEQKKNMVCYSGEGRIAANTVARLLDSLRELTLNMGPWCVFIARVHGEE